MRMDEELEALIDRAGRERVFTRARTYGWSAGAHPPKWVWQEICLEIMAEGDKAGREPLSVAVINVALDTLH